MPEKQNCIEMHCHTVFSPDAYCTPEQLVEKAAKRGVKVFSITDHNHIGAQKRAEKHTKNFDMRYIYGIEVDATVANGRNCHFTCFNYDLTNSEFQTLAEQVSKQYEPKFLEIYPYLKEFGIDLDIEQLKHELPRRYPTNPNPPINQWFARDYLIKQGAIADKKEFTQITKKVRAKLSQDGKLKTRPAKTFAQLRDAVHGAGGKIFLAHVARYYPDDMDTQISQIQELLADGMDGFELYHPDNVKEPEFARLYNLAKNSECLLSSGSDFHNPDNKEHDKNFGNMIVEDWFLERMV